MGIVSVRNRQRRRTFSVAEQDRRDKLIAVEVAAIRTGLPGLAARARVRGDRGRAGRRDHRVDRFDAVVIIAAGHQPDRPSWDCLACALPWPCDAVREELLATMDIVQVAIYAAAHLEQAVSDLPITPPGELFDRFLGWTRRPPI